MRRSLLVLLGTLFALLADAQPPVQSMKELRDAGVVKQRFDFSCGAAALATLLTYGLNDPVDEATILAAVIDAGTSETAARLEKSGLSLQDMAAFAQVRGYRAQGFRVPAEQLARIARPVIVYIKPHGYEHFAVLKGLRGDRVYLADPSYGNVRMPLYQFLSVWTGIVLAVEPPAGWPQRYALELR